jgi:hypothetical protein
MRGRNFAHKGEAKSRSFGASCDERLKYPFALGLRYARTVVCHVDEQPVD